MLRIEHLCLAHDLLRSSLNIVRTSFINLLLLFYLKFLFDGCFVLLLVLALLELVFLVHFIHHELSEHGIVILIKCVSFPEPNIVRVVEPYLPEMVDMELHIHSYKLELAHLF